MFVAPRPGQLYRHPATRQLVPAEGFEADVTDLDIDRALQCGDLVEVKPPTAATSKAAKAKKAAQAPADLAPPEASAAPEA